MKKLKIFILIFFIHSVFCQTENIAMFNIVEGECIIKNNNDYSEYIKAIPGREVFSGDIVKSKEKSFCSIKFTDNKTSLILGEESTIQILDNLLSREIQLTRGNIYIENVHNPIKKTYVFTSNSQIFVDHDKLWLETHFIDGDSFFSIIQPMNFFNIENNSREIIVDKILLTLDSKGILSESLNYGIVPDYVISDVSNTTNKQSIKLNKTDLIPVYGKRINNSKNIDPLSLSFGFGTALVSDSTYLQLGIYPKYKNKNLVLGIDLDTYINPDGDNLDEYWNDFFDILDKVYLDYSYVNNKNKMSLSVGPQINSFDFGQGYLLNDLVNTIDYPNSRVSAIYLKYEFGPNFMDLDVVVPNIRDFNNLGGVLGVHTSLYMSHKFPLTVGLGIVADLNQFSDLTRKFNIGKELKRNVFGAEIDFNYELKSTINKEINLFAELVGIWYPENNYYTISDDQNVSNDLRWRKGVWGIKGPGFSMKFNNRNEFKFSLNYNSATFIPGYFNSTYTYNRARYYTDDDLTFPLVQKQITYLQENFLVPGSENQYFIPKDVHPTLFENSGFSVYPVYGFTSEYFYKIYNYLNFSSNFSAYFENSNQNNSYFSLEMDLTINELFIRNLSYLNFYYSNTFFSDFSDKQRLMFGFESGIDLPYRLALIINLGQVYYDSVLSDNNIDAMNNFGLNLKYNF